MVNLPKIMCLTPRVQRNAGIAMAVGSGAITLGLLSKPVVAVTAGALTATGWGLIALAIIGLAGLAMALRGAYRLHQANKQAALNREVQQLPVPPAPQPSVGAPSVSDQQSASGTSSATAAAEAAIAAAARAVVAAEVAIAAAARAEAATAAVQPRAPKEEDLFFSAWAKANFLSCYEAMTMANAKKVWDSVPNIPGAKFVKHPIQSAKGAWNALPSYADIKNKLVKQEPVAEGVKEESTKIGKAWALAKNYAQSAKKLPGKAWNAMPSLSPTVKAISTSTGLLTLAAAGIRYYSARPVAERTEVDNGPSGGANDSSDIEFFSNPFSELDTVD